MEKPMNRVLEYAARHHQPRGTAYGNASVCMAGIVLAVPVAMYIGTSVLQALFLRPLSAGSPIRLETLLLDAPPWLAVFLPILGMLLGAAALSLRCNRYYLVTLGVLINVSGLIAAIGALLIVG
jgi:hypothetical protein